MLDFFPATGGHYPVSAHMMVWAGLVAVQVVAAIWYLMEKRPSRFGRPCRLQDDRAVVEFVGIAASIGRKVLGQQRMDLGDGGEHGFDRQVLRQALRQRIADAVPKARIDAGVDAAIGQQFDGVIGQVDICLLYTSDAADD